MKIGNIEINNPIALGPMAGVTDLPFRMLCVENGCNLTYTEMVSAKAILYNNKNTDILMNIGEDEHPSAIQLFGSEPEIMGEITRRVSEEKDCDFIDFNMGCPVPKIVGNREGSHLMTEPELVKKILTAMVKNSLKPVTVKMRKGFMDGEEQAVEIAKIAEDCGVAAVTVHGRTRQQYYSGEADWDIIKKVKEAVNIPVIGNGDVVDGKSAKALLDYTGCDGIMIGRAARGNPWIFKQVKTYLETGEIVERVYVDEIISMIIRHAHMLCDYKGEFTGVREMRKHIAWYTAGLPHSNELRRQVNAITDLSILETLLEEILHK